jgi:hypothetical protein
MPVIETRIGANDGTDELFAMMGVRACRLILTPAVIEA